VGLASQIVHVSHIHPSSADAYQHLIVFDERLIDVPKFKDIG
jgi:hypothetical protein